MKARPKGRPRPIISTGNKRKFPRILLTSKSQEHTTPPDFFAKIQPSFNFQLDPATTSDNPLGLKYFITKRMDGLKADWLFDAFLNPPYDQTKEFLAKAVEQVKKHGITVGFLCASRTDTKAMQTIAFPNMAAICFVRGRLKFGAAKNSATFPSAFIVFKKSGQLTKDQYAALEKIGFTIEMPSSIIRHIDIPTEEETPVMPVESNRGKKVKK